MTMTALSATVTSPLARPTEVPWVLIGEWIDSYYPDPWGYAVYGATAYQHARQAVAAELARVWNHEEHLDGPDAYEAADTFGDRDADSIAVVFYAHHDRPTPGVAELTSLQTLVIGKAERRRTHTRARWPRRALGPGSATRTARSPY